ncbi:unnamed protein product [Rotaria socialis]|uniref:Defensin-like protein n=1 Tax=Rotaria socialis TaxID=392032 RepID=A0A821XD29_9BILA|nr:unnamed protein product [Rotaria socialis]CAF4943614.1 unnamed protein product [Rotaria socialis]
MVHWQLLIILTLFISATCLIWPDDNDNDITKMCFHFAGLFDGDLRCSKYCESRGKAGGTCTKKRCVCKEKKSDGDNSGEGNQENQQLTGFIKPNLNIKCQLGSMICRVNCKQTGKPDGSCIDGVCTCSS